MTKQIEIGNLVYTAYNCGIDTATFECTNKEGDFICSFDVYTTGDTLNPEANFSGIGHLDAIDCQAIEKLLPAYPIHELKMLL